MSKNDQYAKKLDLIKKAIACEPVERVPVAFAGSSASATYMGVPLSQYAVKMGVQTDVALNAMEKMGGGRCVQCTGYRCTL